MNSIVGIWTPHDLVLPNVASNVDFAQYYITDSGHIEGLDIDFKAGNWLIYIKDSTGTHWFQSEGTAAVNMRRSEFYPDPGYYTKVRLDNQGNIIDAEDLTEDDLPDHHHDAHNIVGIDKIIAAQFSKSIANNMQNAVEFKYDKKTEGLSADVRIDDYTIVKNEMGELCVSPDLLSNLGGEIGDGTQNGCANHEHEISQINGFNDAVIEVMQRSGLLDLNGHNLEDVIDGTTIIINSNGQLAAVGGGSKFKEHQHEIKDIVDLDPARLEWATNQLISENDDLDLKDGILEDCSNASIGTFIEFVNKYLKEVKGNIEDLIAHKGKVEPQKPRTLDHFAPTDISSQVEVYDVLKNFKIVKASTMLSVSMDKISPKKGRVQVFDGDRLIGDFDCESTSPQQRFEVLYDGDYYEDDPNYSGFFDAVSLKYDNGSLAEGVHTIYFKHRYDDVEEISKPLFVNIFDKNRKFGLDSIKIDVANDKYVSGIPCYEVDKKFTVTPIISNVGQFIPLNCIVYGGQEHKPVAYSATRKEVSFDSCICVYSGYTGETEIIYTCTQPNGTKESFSTKSKSLRYDSSWVESYRVKARSHDPRGLGKIEIIPYDPSVPFVLAQCEAPVVNNIAYNKEIDYTKFDGPNYSGLRSGVLQFQFDEPYSGYYKYIALKFPNVPPGMRSIKVDLVDENDSPFRKRLTGEFEQVALFACIGDDTQTDGFALIGNKYWNGRDSVGNSEFGALDLYRSTDITKVLTFGKNTPTYTGENLYLLLGVQTSLNIARVIKSVEESLNEWR